MSELQSKRRITRHQQDRSHRVRATTTDYLFQDYYRMYSKVLNLFFCKRRITRHQPDRSHGARATTTAWAVKSKSSTLNIAKRSIRPRRLEPKLRILQIPARPVTRGEGYKTKHTAWEVKSKST